MFPLILNHLQGLQDTDSSNKFIKQPCYLDLYLGGPEDDSIGVETCSPIHMLVDTINKLLRTSFMFRAPSVYLGCAAA